MPLSVDTPLSSLSEDTYKNHPIIATNMILKLTARGFQFKLVLAASLHGENDGISAL